MSKESMLTLPAAEVKTFPVPVLAYTFANQPKSQAVLRELDSIGQIKTRVFNNTEELSALFSNGTSSEAGVAIFDGQASGHFNMIYTRRSSKDTGGAPSWAVSPWAVKVSNKCDPARCARQVAADFGKNFQVHMDGSKFPWGLPRSTEAPPQTVKLPGQIVTLVAKLNDAKGLDHRGAIAHEAYVLELPRDARISWKRVVPEPVIFDGSYLNRVLQAMSIFQQATFEMLDQSEEFRRMLVAGVALEPGSRAFEFYTRPGVSRWSVTRPDLHWTGDKLFASEEDDMPGGVPDCFHIDLAYGVNQDKWQRAFEWLTKAGQLLFVVSSDWSKQYIPATQWLVSQMQALGYPVAICTTDNLDKLEIHESEVRYNRVPIGTIWRQFPIHETQGKLVDLVGAVRRGVVRMVPEFGPYGNKVLFSGFRKYLAAYERILTTGAYGPREHTSEYQPLQAAQGIDAFELLQEVLPDSHLIWGDNAYPFTVGELTIESSHHLKSLSEGERDQLVLKVVGANKYTARSYGVLMGIGMQADRWAKWVDECVAENMPFIVQRRIPTGVVRVPVYNISTKTPELFLSRLLIRPYSIGGELVTASATIVPSYTERVHGMVDMAICPIQFR